MLASQMEETKMEDNIRRDNDIFPEVKHKVVINWTPPDEKKFLLKRRFVSPRMLSKSLPRRSKSLFGYRISRSLNMDFTSSKNGWRKSPSSSLDNSSDLDRSSRDLSRSAKIMRALSLSRDTICYKNASIKKSLNFDSPPSPQKSACCDESPRSDSTSINTSFDKLMSYDMINSIESTTSSVLIVSSDSIDENQNQTPQKSRKAKITNSTSKAKENLNHSSGSSSSTSLLRSNLRESIDNVLQIMQTPDLHSFKQEKSKTIGCVASTPRNLIQEFNQNGDSRPQTPENIMRLIPESMSAIKRSHKQEKLYRQQEDACTHQMDYSVLNEDLYKTKTDSSQADRIISGGSCDTTFVKKSQMKKNKFKKTLIYDSDDELSDNMSVSDHSVQWNKATSKEDNSSENRSNEANINKIQDINLSDREKCEESNQNNNSVSDNDNKQDSLEHCDKEIRDLVTQQKKSSSTLAMNVSQENAMMPPASNPSVFQNSSRAVTPENSINLIQQVFTESIKKSHKKVKHENKKIFKPRCLHPKMEVAHNIDGYESIVNATCSSTPTRSFRPNTPDNINSSRLLLTEFNSVKKSHKKDKNNKRISGLAKCHKYQEYRKRSDKNRQDYINKIRDKNSSELFELQDSPGASPNKKKKSNVSAQDEACSSPSTSWGCKNIEDEFKIHTPLKGTSFNSLTALNCVCVDETGSSEKDRPVQVTPKGVDLSRCMTPIARCSKKTRENEDASFERHAHVEKPKTNGCVSHDKSANATALEDKNGRSTPTNTTTELLCDINSIKKSHKKNKHSRSMCKRGRKEPLDKGQTKSVSFSNGTTLEEHAASSLQRIGVCSPSETGMCSSMRNGREDESYADSQPSTSRINDSIRNESNLLNVTPPNDFNAANFVKLFSTTSIKKFHKKERDYNAETKYILMDNERDVSDDGSIFDEEDRSNVAENCNSREDRKYIDNF